MSDDGFVEDIPDDPSLDTLLQPDDNEWFDLRQAWQQEENECNEQLEQQCDEQQDNNGISEKDSYD